MTIKLSEIEKAAEGGTEGAWTLSAWSSGEVWADPGEPTLVARVGWAEDATFIAASRMAIPALTAALREVLALHAPFEWSFGQGWVQSCQECARLGGTDGETSYPCATVRAIAAHVDPT